MIGKMLPDIARLSFFFSTLTLLQEGAKVKALLVVHHHDHWKAALNNNVFGDVNVSNC